MRHVGDITKLSGYTLTPVDCIFGGSPCQDLSVAGRRAGLKHSDLGDEETTRSGLFMDQMRIIKEMRESERASGRTGIYVRPRWMVWENVPGALSSPGRDHKGEDFAAVLEEIIKVAEPGASVSVPVPDGGWPNAGCVYAEDGSWSIAYRVHDAQFWGTTQYIDGRVRFLGTPQRRRRIALVADFGGLSAPEVLFERQGLSRHSEPCGEEGESPSAGAESGAGSPVDGVTIPLEGNGSRPSHFGNGYGKDGDPSFTLNHVEQHSVFSDSHASGIVGKGSGETWLMDEKVTAVSTGGGMPGQGYPCAMVSEPEVSAAGFSYGQSVVARSIGYHEEVSPTIRGGEGGNQKPHVFVREKGDAHAISFQERAGKPGGGKGILIQDEHTGALSTLNIQHVFSTGGTTEDDDEEP